MTRSSKNVANAVALLEFLTGPDAQQALAKANSEYPINPQVEEPPLLKSWGAFKADTIHLSLLGKHNSEAVKIFANSGWR